jgi:TRAP-type uncharacterized transport system substrate-binding protein
MAFAGSAYADDLTIATGKEGGGYDAAARTAATKLAQRGHVVEVVNLNGSDEITLAVCSGNATAGYTQIDAMDARAKEGCNLRPLSNYGNGEYAVILFPPDSDLDALDDLTSANAVLVDTIGSGTSLFWDTIVRIEQTDGSGDDWSEARAVNDPLAMAEPLANFGDIDAVIMVRTEDSSDISNLVSRGWKMGELWDRQIDDYEFNGKPLYEVEKKTFTINSRKTKAYTYKVLSFAVTTEATSRDRELFAVLAGSM